MPNERSHLRQAQHNRDLITALDPTDSLFSDWIATAAFYMALHLIEAWLASKHNQHSTTHTDRDAWGGKVAELKGVVWRNYKELERYSRDARYNCVSFNSTTVQKDILPLLDEIEQIIRSLFQKHP